MTERALGEPSLDEILSAFTPDRPGLAMLVSRGSEVVFERYMGGANLEHGAPVTADTPFHVASVSKQFTAFAIAHLARAGIVDLEADIHEWLPDLADYGAKVSVLNLVHHTGGLRDQWELLMLSGMSMNGLIRQDAILAIAQRQKALNFAPGTDIRYSNTGYSLLAEIVAKASGKSFRQYLHEAVFAPLGMGSTVVYDNVSDLLAGRAMSYRLDGDGSPRQVRLNYSNYGATSLHTTPRDLMKWSRELLHPSVFDPDLIRSVCEPGRLNDGRALNYGFGVMRDTIAGLAAITHGGADAGYRAVFATFPAQDGCVVVLSNGQADVGKVGAALAQAFLGASPPQRGGAADAAALERLAGAYSTDWGPSLTLEVRDGKLRSIGGAPVDADFLADGTFYFGAPSNRFRVREDGALVERALVGGLELAHHRIEPVVPAPEGLKAAEGAYRSDELDVTYDLRAGPAELVVFSLRNPPLTLTPASADAFTGGGVALTLVRDAAGAVRGFTLATGRVRNLRFDRVD